MPELPEVETVCQGLRPWIEGRRFYAIQANRPDLRGPLPNNLSDLVGLALTRVSRRGKTMLWHFAAPVTQPSSAPESTPESSYVLLLHLGMSGQFLINPAQRSPHDHVEFWTEASNRDVANHDVTGQDAGCHIVYRDPRRFGAMRLCTSAEDATLAFARLGPEPLSPSWTAARFHETLHHRNVPLKTLLLDQRVVAGIGNIYASEALFLAQLHPLRSGASLDHDESQRLHAAVQQVLRGAIAAGGSSLRDYHQPSGQLGCFQHQFQVYGRQQQPCSVCRHTLIEQIRLAGRSTFYCPTCQDYP
jgi:formamidopyrimidine-DNA glycosylase